MWRLAKFVGMTGLKLLALELETAVLPSWATMKADDVGRDRRVQVDCIAKPGKMESGSFVHVSAHRAEGLRLMIV